MKILFDCNRSRDVIVVLAIGNDYVDNWLRYFHKSLLLYCEANNISLVLMDEDNDPSSFFSKNGKYTWQKLLIPRLIADRFGQRFERCIYLDSDILANPYGDNVFDSFSADVNSIQIVSIADGLASTRADVLCRQSYLRNRMTGGKYPVDSLARLSISGMYRTLEEDQDYDDFFCAGVFGWYVNSEIEQRLENLYFKYRCTGVNSLTQGGDQVHFNAYVFSELKWSFLPPKYQRIWSLDASVFCPYIYLPGTSEVINVLGLTSVLGISSFLHFAGSGPENQIIQLIDKIDDSCLKSITVKHDGLNDDDLKSYL